MSDAEMLARYWHDALNRDAIRNLADAPVFVEKS